MATGGTHREVDNIRRNLRRLVDGELQLNLTVEPSILLVNHECAGELMRLRSDEYPPVGPLCLDQLRNRVGAASGDDAAALRDDLCAKKDGVDVVLVAQQRAQLRHGDLEHGDLLLADLLDVAVALLFSRLVADGLADVDDPELGGQRPSSGDFPQQRQDGARGAMRQDTSPCLPDPAPSNLGDAVPLLHGPLCEYRAIIQEALADNVEGEVLLEGGQQVLVEEVRAGAEWDRVPDVVAQDPGVGLDEVEGLVGGGEGDRLEQLDDGYYGRNGLAEVGRGGEDAVVFGDDVDGLGARPLFCDRLATYGAREGVPTTGRGHCALRRVCWFESRSSVFRGEVAMTDGGAESPWHAWV